MTRSPDLPPGHRFRFPAGAVVYHGSRLEAAADVIANGLRARKPTGPLGSIRSARDIAERGPFEAALLRQPAAIYVITVIEEARYFAGIPDGTPCIWKINASGLTATADPAYPENPHILMLVSRRVRLERLLALYDCSSGAAVSVSLATRP